MLTSEQIETFSERGYLVLRKVLDPRRVLDPVVDEYEGVVDRLASVLVERGEIARTYRGLEFDRRLIAIYRESGRAHDQFLDFALPPAKIAPDTPFHTGPAVLNVLTDEPLLNCVESLIGPEITSNPIQHNRIKPPDRLWGDLPGAVTQTPLHQDTGVATADAAHTDMLTVWLPILDAPVESGCLKVLPGSHLYGLMDHEPGYGGLHLIAAPDIDPVALPVQRGDVIFLHRLLAHGSMPNTSESIRWSFDLRYNPTGQPTGRAVLPDFVARSRSGVHRELRDAAQWTKMWLEARERLSSGESVPPRDRWTSKV